MLRALLAVLRLASMSVVEKISKGLFIVQQRRKYGDTFPKFAPATPDEMEVVVIALSTAHATATDGGALARAEEKAALAQYDTLFGNYRDWANQPEIAYNDAVKIQQLGLDLSQDPVPTGAMPAPKLLPITGQNEGELDVAAEKADGYRALLWFVAYGETAPADDDYRFCTGYPRLRATLTARRGQMAWVRGLFIGPEGPGPLSAPVSRRVL